MAELQHRMSSREFAEWMAYNSLEPFGHERHDLGHAITARTVAEANRDPKKRSQPFRVEEFMPKFVEEIIDVEAAIDAAMFSLGGAPKKNVSPTPSTQT